MRRRRGGTLRPGAAAGPGEGMADGPIRVLCVDDNDFVAEAIQRRLRRETEFEWLGWLPDAAALIPEVRARKPHVVLMDIDMPGKDSFEALRELAAACPEARVIMLSGHVRKELIDRAFGAGAWGYVSKDADTGALLTAIRRVASGDVVMGDDVADEHRKP